MKDKMNKIDNYIYARLWKAKLQAQSISLEKILAEIGKFYGLDVTDPDTMVLIQERIPKIRHRVDNRYYLWKKKRKTWADLLGVPENIIQKWRDEKRISNEKSVKNLQVILADVNRSKQTP